LARTALILTQYLLQPKSKYIQVMLVVYLRALVEVPPKETS